MLNKVTIVLSLVVGVVLSGCQQDKTTQKKDDFWKDTTEHIMDSEVIKLTVPNKYTTTSIYKYKSTFPALEKNKLATDLMQNGIASFEMLDEEIDVFVDTTSQFNAFLVMDVPRMEFDKDSGDKLGALITKQYAKQKKKSPRLKIDAIDSKLNSTDKLKMMKFKHKLKESGSPEVYNSLYYVTTPSQTVIVLEYSEEEPDIEKYLWSLRDW